MHSSTKTLFLRLLYFTALLFVIIKAYHENLFRFPESIRYGYLITAIVFLLSGMFFSAFSWYKLLQQYNSDIPFLISINSYCKTILSKYIPGKVWSVVSPVTYISNLTSIPVSSLIGLSILHQIVVLWTGILFGILLISRISDSLNIVYVYICSLILLSTLIVFPKLIIGLPIKVYCRLTKSGTNKYNWLFSEKPFFIKSIIVWYCCMWIFYMAGFYFLIASINESDFQILSVLAFPLASVLGIISIFTVGGIGVREGVISYILIKYGFTLELAVIISTFSRLWFLTGEILVFSGSFIISGMIKKKIKNHKPVFSETEG